jgi:SAM-dependent methyltransferase
VFQLQKRPASIVRFFLQAMRAWSDAVLVHSTEMPLVEVFRLAATGSDFLINDYGVARRLHAGFLKRIGTKEVSCINRFRQAQGFLVVFFIAWLFIGWNKGETRTLLSHLRLSMNERHEFQGKGAPATLATACEMAFGPAPVRYQLPYRDAAAAIGVYEMQRVGIDVCGLTIRPFFGIFAPTRPAYCLMLERVLQGLGGDLALDVGSGTGVLAMLLARRFKQVVATEIMSTECAKENVRSNGFRNVSVVQADLFPPAMEDQLFDCIVFNPPWIPGKPLAPTDVAVYDKNGATLSRFLAEAPSRLKQDGRAIVIVSNLGELCGLRGAMRDEIEQTRVWQIESETKEQLTNEKNKKGIRLMQKVILTFV